MTSPINMNCYFTHSLRAPALPAGARRPVGRPPVWPAVGTGNLARPVQERRAPSRPRWRMQASSTAQELSSDAEEDVPAAEDEASPDSIIRIKLKSYWVDLIQNAADKIVKAAEESGARVSGPVAFPTK